MADETTPPQGTAVTRTLKRAAEIVGGVGELAAALGVTEADLRSWMTGEARPSQDIFLAALDIVSGPAYERNARNSQHAADRAQAAADRAQASADRAQGRANRDRAKADRVRNEAPTPAGTDEQLRQMTSREQSPAANKPEQKKKEG